MSDYTEWYPPEVKPVRGGEYQCFHCSERHIWTGKNWTYPNGWTVFGFITWRGLTREGLKRWKP